MRRNEPPFFMMPYGMGMPPQFMMDGGGNPRVPEIIVPPRVEKAMQFLNLLSQKTSPQVAATDHNIQEIEGQKLTEEEANAQATACNLLNEYFGGKLQPGSWEQLKSDAIKRQARRGKRKKNGPDKVSSILHCPMCGGGKKDCQLCQGSGTVFFTPGDGRGEEA